MFSKSILRLSTTLLILTLCALALAQESDKEKPDETEKGKKFSYAYRTVDGKTVLMHSGQEGHVTLTSNRIDYVGGGDGESQNATANSNPVWVTAQGSGQGENMLVLRATSQDADGNPISLDFQADHGRLGIECVELTDELRTHFGAPTHAGIMVGRVDPDGPAADAGFQVGDILTHLNGEPIIHSGQLLNTLIAKKPGDLVDAELWRDGAILETSIILGKAENYHLFTSFDNKAKVLLSPKVRGNFQFKTVTSSDEEPVVEWVNVEATDFKQTIEEMKKKIEELEQKIMERSKKNKEQ